MRLSENEKLKTWYDAQLEINNMFVGAIRIITDNGNINTVFSKYDKYIFEMGVPPSFSYLENNTMTFEKLMQEYGDCENITNLMFEEHHVSNPTRFFCKVNTLNMIYKM